MKNIYFALVICLILSVIEQPAFAQGGIRERTPLLLPQGFGIPLLNSKGVSGFLNDVSNISFMNPASMNYLMNYSVGFSYQFQTSINTAWIADIGTSRIKNYIPQSLGGVLHYNNFSFGIGMGQKYNGSLDIGPIQITTVTNPDGTGVFYTPEFENTSQIYTLSAAYQFEDIFTEKSSLSFGIKYILNDFNNYESLEQITTSASLLGSNVEIGINYNMNFNNEKFLGIGISYSTETEMSNNVNIDDWNNLNIPDSNRIQIIHLPAFMMVVKIPSELNIEIVYRLNSNLEFLGRINNVFWENLSNNSKDQLELSTSAVYSFNQSVDASIGVYYTSKEYIEDFFNINDELYATYITTGVSFQLNIFNIDLAIADSHLLSGDYWQQTIGKISLGIRL